MDNYNWDVVYACSGTYINAQLAANRDDYIQSFDYKDSSIKISGTFGAWEIVPGGSEGLLQFNCPIDTGLVVLKENNKTVTLDGTVPLVQMQLKVIKASDKSASHNLVFNYKTVGKQKGDTTPGAVTVIDPDITGKLKQEEYGGLAAELLVNGLGQCFIQNTDKLSFIFAQVLPTPTGKNSDWLAPKAFSYAYQQPDSDALGGLAILGLLDSTDMSSLPRNFDIALLDKEDFGFLLSAHQFMKNVILPDLPNSLGGNCSVNDFKFDGDTSLTLANNFNLDSVKVGAIHYTPKVQDLTFAIEDTSMRCYIDTKTDITGLTHAYVTNSVTSNNPSSFDIKTRLLSFEKDPNMETASHKHIPWWEEAVGALTLGLMNAIIEGIGEAIENAVEDLNESKTATNFGQVAPGLVSWSGQKNITVNAGGLEDNVFMQGVVNNKE